MERMFDLYPASQSDVNGVGYRTDSPPLTQFGKSWDLRIDHHLSANNLLFVRYADNPVTTVVPEPWPTITSGDYKGISPGGANNYPGPSTTASRNVQIDYVHIFSPATLMDLKAGYTRVNVQSLPFNYGIGASDTLDIPNAHIPGMPQTDGLMAIGSPSFPWGFLGSALGVPLIDINNTFQYSGSVTHTHGPHTIKSGGGFNRRQVAPQTDNQMSGFAVVASTPPFFNGEANMLSGHAVAVLRGNQINRPHYHTWEPYAYAQDDWRVTSKLTSNLASAMTSLRRSPRPMANMKYISTSESFISGTQNKTIGVGTDYQNLAPRFGFAYSLCPRPYCVAPLV